MVLGEHGERDLCGWRTPEGQGEVGAVARQLTRPL